MTTPRVPVYSGEFSSLNLYFYAEKSKQAEGMKMQIGIRASFCSGKVCVIVKLCADCFFAVSALLLAQEPSLLM